MNDDSLQHRADHWPLAGTVRRPAASTASFGGFTFSCGLVIRRTDDMVVVQLHRDELSSDIVELFRAVGVAQLVFDRTLCRARAVGWDVALGAVIFELHRPIFPEVGAAPGEVAHAA